MIAALDRPLLDQEPAARPESVGPSSARPGLTSSARRRAAVHAPGRQPGPRGRAAVLIERRRALGEPAVVQLSRWDRLKDPIGVLAGFAGMSRPAARSCSCRPRRHPVADDPEGAEVLRCAAALARAPDESAGGSTWAAPPIDDVDENAAIVNALQRYAAIVVQKSLAKASA